MHVQALDRHFSYLSTFIFDTDRFEWLICDMSACNSSGPNFELFVTQRFSSVPWTVRKTILRLSSRRVETVPSISQPTEEILISAPLIRLARGCIMSECSTSQASCSALELNVPPCNYIPVEVHALERKLAALLPTDETRLQLMKLSKRMSVRCVLRYVPQVNVPQNQNMLFRPPTRSASVATAKQRVLLMHCRHSFKSYVQGSLTGSLHT